jgi:hypothetical protein
MNMVYTLLSYSFNIQCNIILVSTPKFSFSFYAKRSVVTPTAKQSVEQVLSIKIIYRKRLLYVIFLLYVDPELLSCMALLGLTIGVSHNGKNTRRECSRSRANENIWNNENFYELHFHSKASD